MRKLFIGKNVIVTGGASGIGASIMNELLELGASVIVIDRSAMSNCKDYIRADLSRYEEAERAFGEAFKKFEKVDYVINSCGIFMGGEIRDTLMKNWHTVIDNNVYSVAHSSQIAYRKMIEQGNGHIVNIASMAGLVPIPAMGVYGASEEKIAGSKAAQTANAVAIAKAVGDIYGQDAQNAITAPFVEHIAQSNNYAAAVKTGDMAAQESSLKALRAELRKVADVFHSVIPSLSSDTLYDALSAHEDLLNMAAVEYQNGNYEKAYSLENDALVQISGGADALTTGIIASKPELFK